MFRVLRVGVANIQLVHQGELPGESEEFSSNHEGKGKTPPGVSTFYWHAGTLPGRGDPVCQTSQKEIQSNTLRSRHGSESTEQNRMGRKTERMLGFSKALVFMILPTKSLQSGAYHFLVPCAGTFLSAAKNAPRKCGSRRLCSPHLPGHSFQNLIAILYVCVCELNFCRW